MNCNVYIGDGLEAGGTVLVVNATPNLEIQEELGKALAEKGGSAIVETRRAAFERLESTAGRADFPLGTVVMTGAGELPFQAIAYCVTVDPTDSETADLESVCEKVSGCMKTLLALLCDAPDTEHPHVVIEASWEDPWSQGGWRILDSAVGALDRQSDFALFSLTVAVRDENQGDAIRTILSKYAKYIGGSHSGKARKKREHRESQTGIQRVSQALSSVIRQTIGFGVVFSFLIGGFVFFTSLFSENGGFSVACQSFLGTAYLCFSFAFYLSGFPAAMGVAEKQPPWLHFILSPLWAFFSLSVLWAIWSLACGESVFSVVYVMGFAISFVFASAGAADRKTRGVNSKRVAFQIPGEISEAFRMRPPLQDEPTDTAIEPGRTFTKRRLDTAKDLKNMGGPIGFILASALFSCFPLFLAYVAFSMNFSGSTSPDGSQIYLALMAAIIVVLVCTAVFLFLYFTTPVFIVLLRGKSPMKEYRAEILFLEEAEEDAEKVQRTHSAHYDSTHRRKSPLGRRERLLLMRDKRRKNPRKGGQHPPHVSVPPTRVEKEISARKRCEAFALTIGAVLLPGYLFVAGVVHASSAFGEEGLGSAVRSFGGEMFTAIVFFFMFMGIQLITTAFSGRRRRMEGASERGGSAESNAACLGVNVLFVLSVVVPLAFGLYRFAGVILLGDMGNALKGLGEAVVSAAAFFLIVNFGYEAFSYLHAFRSLEARVTSDLLKEKRSARERATTPKR
jgi:hypothetical protein